MNTALLNVSDPMVGYDTAGYKRLKPLSFSALFSLKTKLHCETVTKNSALCWTVFIYRELFKSW